MIHVAQPCIGSLKNLDDVDDLLYSSIMTSTDGGFVMAVLNCPPKELDLDRATQRMQEYAAKTHEAYRKNLKEPARYELGRLAGTPKKDLG